MRITEYTILTILSYYQETCLALILAAILSHLGQAGDLKHFL